MKHTHLFVLLLSIYIVLILSQYYFFEVQNYWACFRDVSSSSIRQKQQHLQHLTSSRRQPLLTTNTNSSVLMPPSWYEPCLASPFDSQHCLAAVQPLVRPRQHLRRLPPQSKSRRTAALCLVVKNEHLYLNEFVDYHLALGFDEIWIYDNSQDFNLRPWYATVAPSHRVVLQHWPGEEQQLSMYRNCTLELQQQGRHTWVAAMDVDEMLILQKHEHVVDLLEEHVSSGTLAIYWYYFGWGNQTRYQPRPMTQRFLYRDAHAHVLYKTIAKLSDVDPDHLHIHILRPRNHKKGVTHHDARGNNLKNRAPAPDWISQQERDLANQEVAAIYHYWSKSVEEYYIKSCLRGRGNRAGPGKWRNCDKSLAEMSAVGGQVYDRTGWEALQRLVPEYAVYETTQ